MTATRRTVADLAADLRRRYDNDQALAHMTAHEWDWGNRAAFHAGQLAFALAELEPERVAIGNARRARVDRARQEAS